MTDKSGMPEPLSPFAHATIKYRDKSLIVSSQLCWKDVGCQLPLSFHLSRCLYVCTDVGFLSLSKGKPLLSNENAMTDFRQTWYVVVGGTSTTHMVCCHQMPKKFIPQNFDVSTYVHRFQNLTAQYHVNKAN